MIWLLKRLIEKGVELPKFYLACGAEDSLLASNRDYRDLLEACGADLTWYEGPGGHEWDFWDDQIKRVIDWLPLDDAGQGFGSGAIG